MTSTATVTSTLLMCKGQFCCNECHRKFRNKEALYIHAEACIMEAFESEVISAFNDVPFSAIRRSFLASNEVAPVAAVAVNNSTTGFGITVKKSNLLEREEFVTIKVGEEQSERDEGVPEDRLTESLKKSDVYHPKLITYGSKNDDISQAQTIEGPNGLKLVVSVEKPESAELPPTLNPEDSASTEQADGEANVTGADGFWDEEDNIRLDTDDVSDRELVPGTSFNPLNRPQVIGALANANDDPYKPKMECPTCGLVLYRHNFSTHYRIHTGELPFFCEFCPKRFRYTSSSLKVHVRAHTGEKPYICPMCGYSTITKRNLDRHIENHHVRLGGSRGPATRKSRYRGNADPDWMDDVRSHVEPRFERSFHGDAEEPNEWEQENHLNLVQNSSSS